MAKGAMGKLTKVWKDRNITKNTKARLVRTLIFSIFLYGVETWTIKESERKKIDAFEMWCWRRMLRIPWTAKRANVSILNELSIKDRLSTTCYRRILQFFGHIARRDPDCLEKLVVVGSVEERRSRGRSPTRWSNIIKSVTGSSVTDALRSAQNMEANHRKSD